MLLRQPIIKLPDPISPGGRIQFPDTPSGGPESPLERNPLSPMGWKKREAEGVGLGIVAALERSDSRGPRAAAVAIAAAVAWPKAEHEHGWRRNDAGAATTIGARRAGERRGPFFCGSPPTERRGQRVLPVADFLSNCHLCRKSLHGKDIYMYRYVYTHVTYLRVNINIFWSVYIISANVKKFAEGRRRFAAPNAGTSRSRATSSRRSADRKHAGWRRIICSARRTPTIGCSPRASPRRETTKRDRRVRTI
ncbi:uncharacterized protein M6B38_288290 [Iris pallida]|uniref:FLZ-type domain-containing protein n=1 Tax=Iris pallida TaxID=29817 RepID=A0AAX6HV42_IRIPA|nr:uncharacterized protein M6B38_288290 [Iris pallida]